MPKYIIGIDGGSQSAKIIIYDLDGNIVCEGREPLKPMYLPDPDTVEHPGDDLWDAVRAAACKAMAAFPGDKGDIIGAGIGVIRCCRVLLKKDGTLSQQAISWQDKRVASPYQHTNPETAYVTSTSGYITHRLTGEFKDCVGNYFGQWPVDFDTWNWSEDKSVIEKFGIPREMLFDIYPPGTVVGHITEAAAAKTGLPAGLPLACTTADKAVEALGAGMVDDESVVISLGTYIALMISGKEWPSTPQAFWGIISSMPKRFLYEGYGIRRGMWTISWFRDLLGEGLIENANRLGLSPEEYLSREAERVPPGSDGLMTVLDWLANPWEPFKRGIMIGFNAHMDYAFMYRSILEGIAMTMKNNCDAMCAELGRPVKRVIISGGGSNSDLFMQIFADVFGIPAVRNEVNGSAGIGAAINAAVAVGAYKDYSEAVSRMVKIRDTFMPISENTELYHRLNSEVYSTLTSHTDIPLKKAHEITSPQKDDGSSFSQSWSQG